MNYRIVTSRMIHEFLNTLLVVVLAVVTYYVKETTEHELSFNTMDTRGEEYVLYLKKKVGEDLLPVVRRCIFDIERTAREIHSSSSTERKAKFGGSAAGVVGTALTFFPPTSFIGAALLTGGALTGIGSWIGGWAHQKSLYSGGMEKIEAKLKHHLLRVLEKVADVLERLQSMEKDKELIALTKEVQILYVTLRHVAFMWDSKADDKAKETWLGFLGLSGTVASGTGLSAVGVQSTILTGKAWKAARTAAIKDAIEAWKAARAAGDVTKVATKASVIKNAVDGLNAARSASTMASQVLSGLGASLSVVAFVWDSYELHADNPTDMEQDCRSRAEQLRELGDYLADFSGH